ncbi:hydrogenase maturation protease [Anaerotignum propionicum]|nr:hydrogenase maturation protease [Anaerotignum propionicum]MEA5057136.1 hydrogenase maturation protease [Anaerotignum propionicum]
MIKLVAIGNRFMKDDGIAIEVAEHLEERLKKRKIDVVIGETDCQSAFYSIHQEDYVFILDAFYEGGEPGTIHVLSLEEAIGKSSGSPMQHDMSMIDMMRLYHCKWKGYLIGVEIGEVGFGEGLSPILQERFQEICLEVEKNIIKIILEEINYA